MSFGTDRGLENALLRRVRGHTSLATIFRAVDSSPTRDAALRGSRSARETIPQPQGKVVQAFLISTSQMESPDPVIESPDIARDTHHPRMEPAAQNISAPNVPTESSPMMIKETHQDEGETSRDSESQETGWRRLKAIFRKHQEKQILEQDAASPIESQPSPIQRESVASPLSSDRQVSDLVEHPEPEASASPLQSAAQLRGDQPVSERANHPSKHTQVASIQPISDTSDHQPMQTSGAELAESGSQSEHSRTSLSQLQGSDSHTQVMQPPQATPESAPKVSMNEKQPAPEVEFGISPSLQSLPLEAVWPVQRQPVSSGMEKAEGEVDIPEHEEATVITPSQLVQTESSGEAIVPKAIQDISPGRPTDSSIEYLPPRRPRPDISPRSAIQAHVDEQPSVAEGGIDRQLPTPFPRSITFPTDLSRKAASLDQENPATTAAFASASPSKSRPYSPTLQKQQVDEIPDEAGNLQPFSISPPESVQAVQREESESETSLNEVNQLPPLEQVHTEIGSLPADLWHLLNQSPPERSSSGESSPEPVPTDIGRDTQTWGVDARKDASPALPELSVSEAPQKGRNVVDHIQRTVTQEPGVSEAAAVTSQTETGSPDRTDSQASSSPEVNTTELAKRVYAEIKRKLAVEWERGRWRA